METSDSASLDDGLHSNEDEKEIDLRAEGRRLALTYTPCLWVVGFGMNLCAGYDIATASSKATAYAISVLAGWVAFLWIFKPIGSWYRGGIFVGYFNVACAISHAMTRPITPPFPSMLVHFLLVSIAAGSFTGLAFRLISSRQTDKKPARSGSHPLSDDQIG